MIIVKFHRITVKTATTLKTMAATTQAITYRKNRQSTTACGYCCYYLEYFSETNNTQMQANQ